MSLSDVQSAVSALDASLSAVHGADDRTRHYAPMSLGAFADALDDLADGGWAIERLSTGRAHVHDAAATYNIVVDEDQTVAQLLQGKEAWTVIERVLKAHIDGDVGADDAPSDDASKETKVQWLQKQADKVLQAATQYRDKAISLGKEDAEAVKRAGRTAVNTAKKAAEVVKRGASYEVKKASDAVKNTLDAAAKLAGWGAGIGIGVIAIAAVIIYASAKSGATQRRSNRFREDFTRGARQAGVM